MSDEVVWSARLDVARESGSFDDLAKIVKSTFILYSRAEKLISPWNARQQDAKFYMAPSREFMKESLASSGTALNEFAFNAFITGLVRFCEKHKGKKQLPLPHPSTHHSTHWPDGTFEIRDIKDATGLEWLTEGGTPVSKITLMGIVEPLYVKNLRLREFKYLIVRPKLSKLGTASATAWEALFFKNSHGFLVDHVDSNLNPRYAGIF